MRRRDIEGGIVALHTLHRRAHAHGLEREVRVAHFDVNAVHRLVSLIGRAGDEVRDAHVLGDDGVLERAHFIDDMAVTADGVRRGGENVDLFVLHDERRHIVGDDRHVKAHVVADGRRQARALKIRARFGAEQPDVFVAAAALTKHRADDGLGEAVRHHRSVVGEHID